MLLHIRASEVAVLPAEKLGFKHFSFKHSQATQAHQARQISIGFEILAFS